MIFTSACVMFSLAPACLFLCVHVTYFSVWTTGVCTQHILVPVLPHIGNYFVNGDVPLLWAGTACCLTWFSSIKEANRLLTPASIPHRFSHAYKPISVAAINTGLIIVSPGQSRLPRSTPRRKSKSPKVSINLGGPRADPTRNGLVRKCNQMNFCCMLYFRVWFLRKG